MSRLEGRLESLSDSQLLLAMQVLIQRNHDLEAELVAHLGEVDARRLYLEQACPSMFHYCVQVLHFAEAVAYKRIAVARAARKFPAVLVALENGDLHLTGACLIAPHLDDESAAEWVSMAHHASVQEIKQRIADRKPRPDVKTSVRKSPTPRLAEESDNASAARRGESAGEAMQSTAIARAAPTIGGSKSPSTARSPAPSAEKNKARCEPLGAGRTCIRFMADPVVHGQLKELQALLRSSIPDGDVAKILARAVAVLLEQVLTQKIGSRASPRSPRAPTLSDTLSKTPSRHIPAAIRREVWARDGGRCTYVSREGRQCGALEYLEFHHQVPWARSREHAPSNISLRCRPHNQYEAELAFGTEHMAAYRKSGPARPDSEEAEPGASSRPESQVDSNPVGVPRADPRAGTKRDRKALEASANRVLRYPHRCGPPM